MPFDPHQAHLTNICVKGLSEAAWKAERCTNRLYSRRATLNASRVDRIEMEKAAERGAYIAATLTETLHGEAKPAEDLLRQRVERLDRQSDRAAIALFAALNTNDFETMRRRAEEALSSLGFDYGDGPGDLSLEVEAFIANETPRLAAAE